MRHIIQTPKTVIVGRMPHATGIESETASGQDGVATRSHIVATLTTLHWLGSGDPAIERHVTETLWGTGEDAVGELTESFGEREGWLAIEPVIQATRHEHFRRLNYPLLNSGQRRVAWRWFFGGPPSDQMHCDRRAKGATNGAITRAVSLTR